MPGWLIAVLVTVVVIEALWIVSIVVLRRSSRVAARMSHRRPVVSWQAGRWDGDARHAYVANLGEDAAYDVIVTDRDRVLAVADTVPPYETDRLAPDAALPCYLSFLLKPPPASPVLRVSWRSADDLWFAQVVPMI